MKTTVSCYICILIIFAIGCGDPVDHLFWLIEHPNQRRPDEFINAIQDVEALTLNQQDESRLFALVKDDDPAVRAGAVSALALLPVDRQVALPVLIELKDDPSSKVRRIVMGALGQSKFVSDETILSLYHGSFDRDDSVRHAAIKSILAFGTDAKRALPLLIDNLADALLRDQIVISLRTWGLEGQNAIPKLVELLESKDISELSRIEIARTLWMLEESPDTIVPVLVACLKSRDSNVRRESALALGEIGPEANEAVPILEKLASRKNETIDTTTESENPLNYPYVERSSLARKQDLIEEHREIDRALGRIREE